MNEEQPTLRKLSFRQRLGLAIMLLVDGAPVIKAGEATFQSGLKIDDLKVGEWAWIRSTVCIDWFGRTYVESVRFCQGGTEKKREFKGVLRDVKVEF